MIILFLYSPGNLFTLLAFIGEAFFCCATAGPDLLPSFCCFTTGATVGVTFGLTGGFLLTGDCLLLGDSSDSEEYTAGLDFETFFSFPLLLSPESWLVSFFDLTCLTVDEGTFFLFLSESEAFWLTAELLEFSESEELDSLPELLELLEEEPELVLDVDSELVAYKKSHRFLIIIHITSNLPSKFLKT